ncbi:MAG: exopolyphosphatase [Halospina sp.]
MTSPHSSQDAPRLLAAVDLGSNSFHMVVAQAVHGEIRTIEKMGEKVQLGAGLDRDNYLSAEARERGLACLQRFAQRIRSMEAESVRVVGTNALRAARNAEHFIHSAEEALGCPVEIVAGREEARLIYLGVSHTLSDDAGPRLVIDIGGGSTEFIIGERFEPREMESLHMGCVSFRNTYFPDGKISRKRMDKAITHARQELLNIQHRFRQQGWRNCVGSSGSIKAIIGVVNDLNLSREGVTWEAMKTLRKRLIDIGRTDKLGALGVREDRRSIFPAGFAILYAAFESLGIESLAFADGALREGVLYDLVGRDTHEDVRERTIQALQERYSVDLNHASAVEATAIRGFDQVALDWGLNTGQQTKYTNLLRWTCRVHEIGLAISHTQYHKHGAYLMTHSDLPGFSREDQRALATLVRAHRRKFNNGLFEHLAPDEIQPIKRLAVLLRLAVMLQHARTGDAPPPFSLSAKGPRIRISLPSGWLDQHPLTLADLESERDYVKQADIDLVIQE